MTATSRNQLLKGIASFSVTFGPMYLVESVANYLFLGRDPSFYIISGSRIDLFVAIALVGSVVAGALLLDLKEAIATQASALGAFFSFAYVLCNPNVCFSAGPDGLEPLRMGIFLGAIAIAGASIGLSARRRTAKSPGVNGGRCFRHFRRLGLPSGRVHLRWCQTSSPSLSLEYVHFLRPAFLCHRGHFLL